MERKAYIGAIATASPPCILEQSAAAQLAATHYQNRLSSRNLKLFRSLLDHPSIKRRRIAIDRAETLLAEDADARIARFTHWSTELSAGAIREAVRQAGIELSDIAGLVVNTCTGYICPGIATYLIERLGLRTTLPVYDLVGSGCGGAIPNLEIAESLLRRNGGGPVLSVSVEICTATYQMGNDVSLLLSNTLFGDGAAAAVLWPRAQGFELLASASRYVPEQRESIRYVHRNGELHNQLSLKLPGLVRTAVGRVVADLLGQQGLAVRDVRHWALHSGGEKIINAVKEELGLSEEQVHATRAVLAEHGNMSSPTVWFVLKELERRGIGAGELCVMLAFGAGLSAHGFLLRKV